MGMLIGTSPRKLGKTGGGASSWQDFWLFGTWVAGEGPTVGELKFHGMGMAYVALTACLNVQRAPYSIAVCVLASEEKSWLCGLPFGCNDGNEVVIRLEAFRSIGEGKRR